MTARNAAALLAAVTLSGCGTVLPPAAFEGGTPELRPETFFAGTTTSTGVVENRSGAPTTRFQVHGEGHRMADGRFVLVQQIIFEGQPPKERTWTLTKVNDHHYVGSLTDATGAIQAEAYGNLFHLTYPMAEPPLGRMEQWLYLQPDGHTVVNEATVSLLGVTAARLSERITHAAITTNEAPK